MSTSYFVLWYATYNQLYVIGVSTTEGDIRPRGDILLYTDFHLHPTNLSTAAWRITALHEDIKLNVCQWRTVDVASLQSMPPDPTRPDPFYQYGVIYS